MTPILVRPVREQLEHDRVIRLLQQRWRRKYLATVNQGSETTASVVHGDIDAVSRRGAGPARQAQQARDRRRGGDRRVGEPPRGDGAVDAAGPAEGGVSPVSAGRVGGSRPAAVHRLSASRWTRSGPTTSWATRCASRRSTRRRRRAVRLDGPTPRRSRRRALPRRRASRRRSPRRASRRPARPRRSRASPSPPRQDGAIEEDGRAAGPARPKNAAA